MTGQMDEHLLNMGEACAYLGVDEHKLKEMVRKKVIPAYRIGGSYLRFRKDQLDLAKSAIVESPVKTTLQAPIIETTGLEKVKDFLYFNDFYLVSAVLTVLAIVVIFAS